MDDAATIAQYTRTRNASPVSTRHDEARGHKPIEAALHSRLAMPGTRAVAPHWRLQFAFAVQGMLRDLEAPCYYLDYQRARIVILDSTGDEQAHVP